MKVSHWENIYDFMDKWWEKYVVREEDFVDFSIGSYVDRVICDVIPMTCHIILGRPWQDSRDTIHHGLENVDKDGLKFHLNEL